jgi:hypothetical protein
MTCRSAAQVGDHDTIRFTWDAGGCGTMELSWRGGLIAALVVTFD